MRTLRHMMRRPCANLADMGGETQEFAFRGYSTDTVWAAAVRAAGALGYSVLHSDQTSKVLSFNTGRSMSSWAGQDLSMTLTQVGPDCMMTMGGSLGKGGNPFGGGQAFAWGEKGRLIQAFVAKVVDNLPSSETTPQAPVGPPTGLVDQMERLAALRLSGALTEDEFRAAKARLLS